MFFVEAITEPLRFLVDPSKRIFFIYLLSSIALGLMTLMVYGDSLSTAFQKMLNPKVWGHYSSKIDFGLLILNSLLKSALFFVVVLSAIGVSKSVVRFLYQVFPDFEPVSWGQETTILLYTVVSLVALDFSRFFQHYLFHKIPFLWRFHKVHHSAEVMTPITLYRTHPVGSLVSTLRSLLVTGVIAGLFIFYTRSVISGYAILGVNALDFIFNFFGSNLRHSHIWLSFGFMERVFVSPAQHQIHHSRATRHQDKNLGFTLSLWDQLFGTYYSGRKREFLIFGVRGERHRNLWQALKAPLNQSEPK